MSQTKIITRAGRTLADVDAFGEDARVELIDGVLFQLPATSFEHGHIASLIVMAIGPAYQLGKGGPGGWWIQGENDFEVDGREVFRPDAMGWRKSRLPHVRRQNRIEVVPDWVCEVHSSGTRRHDLKTKASAYARIGVAHRWYVDPDVRVLHAFELKRGRWVESGVFCDHDLICTKPFEAIKIPMAELWAEAAKTPRPKMTTRQGELLAFIHAYLKVHQRPPAEHEICARFSLMPPSVHDTIMRMEKAGLIARTPRQARSIRILVPEEDIPPLGPMR